jgi:hypothetical protein
MRAADLATMLQAVAVANQAGLVTPRAARRGWGVGHV